MKRFTAFLVSTLLCISAFAQGGGKITVSGVVTDSQNVPVIGVSVVEAGTTNGISTDIDGKYSITVPRGAKLEFSCIGLATQVITANSTTINVVLQDDQNFLEETVVVGYGIQRKSDVTGAISSVKAEDLADRSITSVDSGLQGKTAGVQIVSTSGAPGSESSIRVRGYSSNSDSTPLYVVDGLRTKNINNLDPSDIGSIEVLKDAASAAIYGASAGNGVVLVTTKKAKEGVTRIGYDMQYSFQDVARIPEVLNAQEYINWVTEGNLVSQDRINQFYDGKTDTKWADVAFEQGSMQRHNVSFQGANKDATLFASLSYLSNDGPVIGNQDKHSRLTGTVNASYNIKKWLKLTSNNSFAKFGATRVREGGMYSMLGSVLQMDPLTPVTYSKDNVPAHIQALLDQGHAFLTDENGDYYSMSPFQESNNINPYIMRDGYQQQSEGFNFRGSTSLDFKPIKQLTFTSRIGYDFSNRSTYNLQWPHTVNTDTNYDYVTISASESHNNYWQWENFANYNQTFAKKHNVSAMLGMSFSSRSTYDVTASVSGTSASNIGISKLDRNYAYFANATGTATKTISGGEKRNYAELSYFGRVGYDFDQKYFIQASLRADAADLSILPLSTRWGFFPAVSGGWTMSREDWFKNNVPAVSFLKLRASWGQNGSIAGLSNYMYGSVITSTIKYPIANDGSYAVGSLPSSTGNYNLKWETSEQINVGLDLRMLKDRLSFSMDWYKKSTKDLIMTGVKSSLSVGNTISPLNAGNVENSGFEFDINWKDQIGDFGYSISANLATLKNRVTYIYPTLSRVAGNSGGSGITCFFEKDYPIWYMRGYKYEGVNPEDGSPVFADLDDNGSINDNDKTMIGAGIPDLTYGITLNLSWKGVDLTVFANGAAGNEIAYAVPRSTRIQANTLKYFYDNRWTPQNTNAQYIGASLKNYDKYVQSSAMVFDGSYFKIKQIQLGYTFPKNLLKKVSINSPRVYVSLDDYFNFTSYPGFDPEVSMSGNGLGLDYGQYPVTKRATLGVNLSF